MNFIELTHTIALLERRERQAGSAELKRELRMTLSHFRKLREDQIRKPDQRSTHI